MPGRSSVSSAEFRYRFTGKERDVNETSWDYFGARYYDSRIGRWLGVDPLADKYAGWSGYSYSFNNSIKNIDPNGKEPKDILAENNDKNTQQNKNKNEYVSTSQSFYEASPRFKMTEGVGAQATYFISGGYSVQKELNGNWSIDISATGKTPSSANFDVEFWGNATLMKDNKEIKSSNLEINNEPTILDKDFTNIGNVSFTLPETGKIQVKLTLGLTIRAGGPGVGQGEARTTEKIIDVPVNNKKPDQ